MIKRIIFDIDNTLLNSSLDYVESYKEFCSKYNTKYSSTDLYNTISLYEIENTDFSKDRLVKFLNDKLENFTIDMFEDLLDITASHATLYEEIEKTISYLKNKYELYALTNWYYESQMKRLEKVNLLKYFDKVYGVDNLGAKPNLFVFEQVVKPYNYNEVAIVGDSIVNDIVVPNQLGMNAIHINRGLEKTEFREIKTINELEELL